MEKMLLNHGFADLIRTPHVAMHNICKWAKPGSDKIHSV